MNTVNEVQDEIIGEFEGLTDWMDRYAYIIDLGNTLPEYPESEKTPQNLIEGCQSRVWIDARAESDGAISFRADSDALIVKGIVALLMRVLDHRTPDEILGADLYFIDRIGLREHLSPTRSNGLVAMVRQINDYARAFKIMNEGRNASAT
ncbi:MAG: SufE family protein [Muribaculaceae bacterium]|nr:SufE family protein [Muribaculaceae bacterium]